MPEQEKPYLSPSQINSYTRCGEAYRRRYIEKQVIPPPFAMLKGSAVHVGAQENFTQKIDTKTDLRPKTVVDIAVASFDGKLKQDGVFLSEEEESTGEKKVEGMARDSTARMAEQFAIQVAPLREPIEVEKKVRLSLPGPRDLLGFIDLILTDGIQDLKTSAKKKTQAEIDAEIQFTIYAAFYLKLYGKAPERIIVDNIVDYVTDAGNVITKHNPMTTTRTGADFNAIANVINAVAKGIGAGMFMPATCGAWWCSAKSCGYWRTCPFVNSERRAASDKTDGGAR